MLQFTYKYTTYKQTNKSR